LVILLTFFPYDLSLSGSPFLTSHSNPNLLLSYPGPLAWGVWRNTALASEKKRVDQNKEGKLYTSEMIQTKMGNFHLRDDQNKDWELISSSEVIKNTDGELSTSEIIKTMMGNFP
jgi:hypothetical protein